MKLLLFITEELKDAIVKELNEYATLINIVIKKKMILLFIYKKLIKHVIKIILTFC